MARTALVSGGGRGLGAAITRRLLADGWQVSIGVRRPQAVGLDFNVGELSGLQVCRFDAALADTAEDWVAEAVARFGGIDALVNNAGVLRMVGFDTGTESDLDLMWETNVKAPFRLIRAALPHLRKAGAGRVINIASTDAKRYRDASVSLGYVMTKHALLAMSHAVRFAGWEDGVRATAICPGAIDTEMIADLPGVTSAADRLDPATVAGIVAFLLTLPNQASVPEFIANTRLESTL